MDGASVTSLDDLERDIDACVELISSRAPPGPKQAWSELKKPIPKKVVDRLERWTAARNATMARREQMQKQNEARVMSECTFRPRLECNTASTTTSDEPVHERLLHRHVQAAAEIEARRRQQSRLDPAEFTFRPKINARSRALLDHRSPIHERANDLQREAIYRRQTLQAQYAHEAEAELTFRPEINRTSAQLVRRRRRQQQEQAGPAPRPGRVAASASDYDDELRFRPEINDFSRELVHRLQISNRLPVDFVQRQALLMQQRQTSRLQRQPRQPRPKSNAAAILRNQSQDRTDQDVFVRMSKVDWEQRDRKQTLVREQFYAQFDFAPKINHRSRALAAATQSAKKVDERLSDDRARQSRERIRRQIEQERGAECSFRPKLSRVAASAQGLYAFSDPVTMGKRIEQYTASKEAKLEVARKAMEREQLKECSFTPSISSEIQHQSATEIVVVRGLNRFLELKQLSEKRKQEQSMREEMVFRVKHADKYRNGNTTVPKPFRFATAGLKRDLTKERLATSVAKAENEVCTFQAETISRKQRQLIDRILNDMSDHDQGL